MKIHKEGFRTIVISTFVAAAIIVLTVLLVMPAYPILGWITVMAILGLLVFILSFFRIPARDYSDGEDVIVAPCDGTVVVIEEVQADEYFKDRRLQLSIFMSPLNVHVNRNPVSGEVMYSEYHKGKYLVAWHPKSSTENERHSVVYKSGGKELLVKQIAGALAKRIVNYLKPGDNVKQAEEMGFIKFGSRVDLLLPIGTKIEVNMNQKVKGGVTVLARW
ncbi:phosphatidylserine decarboxylase family protein [Flavisolibacter ginsenosidimutans]|uniref:Phosphatidylserine decarboxylase proenzyme n=1 Tax=Flavisolibacter ginsenosidimutans TaxID=661481 RepID=A0A5B8ULW8_9BACT|nr:phosphatidylserine decarboxylase family protein [Flavisolibacter ginsenosidimutans]QEC57667.1 phosphatidylserine decarboxylase family protein [Flavisolibacter ginsenosidimutans]